VATPLVTPCNANGYDTTKEMTTYTTTAASIIMGLCFIKAVVRCIQSCGRWTNVQEAFAEVGKKTDYSSN
jgi:hypothetical protein